jgi:hypothetical protein
MADRLRFAFVRQSKLLQVGLASIDVLDPTDAEEIGDKLKALDFKTFVVTQEDLEEPQWSFQPFVEDVPGG